MKTRDFDRERSELLVSLPDFLKSYNKTIPAGFPRASTALLKKFKDSHATLFKHGDLWSLDEHRKKIIDWLPQLNLSSRYSDSKADKAASTTNVD